MTYHNPLKQDTFEVGCKINLIRIHQNDRESIEIHGDTIGAPYAQELRAGKYGSIEVFFDAQEGSNDSEK